jgi:hypothetical protein
MKRSNFTLVLILMLGISSLWAQNQNPDIKSAAELLYKKAIQSSKIANGVGLRSQFIHQPDSLTFSFWDVDKQTAQVELQAGIKWKTLNGSIVIDQEILYQEGVAFALTYTYNNQNQITGGQVRLFLGPLPIPAGSLVINRDSRGNITRAGLELNVLGEMINQGDSSRIVYNSENQMTSVTRYFYDAENENGAGWYLRDRHENMEYCQDGALCSMLRIFVDEQGLEYIENYTSMEWYDNADKRYLQALLPGLDEYAPRLPFAFFPADPINEALGEPISYAYEVSTSPGFIYRRSNYPYNDGEKDWLCTSLTVELEGEDPIALSDYRCYSFDEDSKLILQHLYADEDLQILVNASTYNYNDYGYLANSNNSNGFTSYTEEYVFETDNDNRLRKIDLTTAFNPEFGEPALSGSIAEFFYKQGTAVINSQVMNVFETFPNPAEQSLFVAIQTQHEYSNKNIELRIRSLKGEVVYSQYSNIANKQVIELPISNLPASLYILECFDVSGEHLATSKFIKK